MTKKKKGKKKAQMTPRSIAPAPSVSKVSQSNWFKRNWLKITLGTTVLTGLVAFIANFVTIWNFIFPNHKIEQTQVSEIEPLDFTCNLELDISKQLALYDGRFGASFKYPSNWDKSIQPIFASMDKALWHPVHPEFYINYYDGYNVTQVNEDSLNIGEVIYEPDVESMLHQDIEYLKSIGAQIDHAHFFEKSVTNCKYPVDFYRIKYLWLKDGVKYATIRIATAIKEFDYSLSINGPQPCFDYYEDELIPILYSFDLDCDDLIDNGE